MWTVKRNAMHVGSCILLALIACSKHQGPAPITGDELVADYVIVGAGSAGSVLGNRHEGDLDYIGVSPQERHAMSKVDEIRALIAAQPKPVCVELTPFELIDVDPEAGFVKLEFAAQPAFRNHFGNIQAGFAVAILDVALSLAAYLKLGLWLPTIELKSSFLNPARIGTCVAEGRVLKAGKRVAFLEAKLWGIDGELAVHATATVAMP